MSNFEKAICALFLIWSWMKIDGFLIPKPKPLNNFLDYGNFIRSDRKIYEDYGRFLKRPEKNESVVHNFKDLNRSLDVE